MIGKNLHRLLLLGINAGLAGASLEAQVTIPSNYVLPVSAANTNKPGFIWNTVQVFAPQPSRVADANAMLAGEVGVNTADPSAVNDAAGPATVPSNPQAPISFHLPAVLNFALGSTSAEPGLPAEDPFSGIPGTTGSTVNFAAEALTWLSLPAGQTTIAVRSDDGCRLQIGGADPSDHFSTNAVTVLQYDGTRGAADSVATINVSTAGLYAARVLYFQASGGANLEFFTYQVSSQATNAVLVNDLANGGIAAYAAVTMKAGSYASDIQPSPDSTGVSPIQTISATIVNGLNPVSGVALAFDGTNVNATLTTTTNGATVSYTAPLPFASGSTHAAAVSWTDNGKQQTVAWSFTTRHYVYLSASQTITPDTTKPGFRFNIFANASDPFLHNNANGFLGGETDFLDNTELGLNGLVPDGSGGFLPNNVTLANKGAAIAAAPALGGPNAPAEFIVAGSMNLISTNNSMPGLPAQDGATDPSHSEVLTYVHLPVGLTTFTLNLDGFYRAFVGSWDYTAAIQVGSLNDALNGSTSFSVYAAAAGYYPLRLTALNLDGTPQLVLSATPPTGTNALVGDVAHGGLAAYYALSTPSKPYLRYTSPRPVPRQMLYPNNRVLLRLQDADTKVMDSSAVFNLNGNNVPVTKNRVGDVLELTWTPTNLYCQTEMHTGVLSYQDSSGNSLSNQWSFMNVRAIFLPTAAPGYWIPTNAVAIEDFSEYPDGTALTNGPPTTTYYPPFSFTGTYLVGAPAGQWYKSPQPENPLVDVAPIWTNIPAGPADWFVWNWDESEGAAKDVSFSTTDPNSGAYANFFVVDLTTFSGIEGSSINTDPGQTINGVPLVQIVADPSNNVFMAESDNRAGDTTPPAGQLEAGQTQFAMSKRFDLSGAANPVLAFAAIQRQNQDNLNSVEYSVDGGATWAPVAYYLDGHYPGGDASDVQLNLENTVNVMQTLYSDGSNPAEVPFWTDSDGHTNRTYASVIAAPISQALAPFFAPRPDDEAGVFPGMRLEVVRLPLAAHQSNVRLRLSQIGTCSWYFGVANIAFYDVPLNGSIVPTGLPSAPPTRSTLSISTGGGKVTITWTGTGVLQWATKLTGSPSDWSAVTPAPAGNAYSATIGAGNLFFRVVSN